MEYDRTEGGIKINGKIHSMDTTVRAVEYVAQVKGEGLVKNSHDVPYLYRQDVVKHKISGSIGIVKDVAGDSDSESSDDDFPEEGNEEDNGNGHLDDNLNDNDEKESESSSSENLEVNQVRVLWLGDTEKIQQIDDVQLLDRGFLHGDYVACAADPTGQVGVVQDVNISVDLLAPDGSIVKDVSSRYLRRVREFTVGDYVVNGPWLGRVDDVLDNVTVLIDDGSSCKVVAADPLHLKPHPKNNFCEDSQYPFYPGQRVRASSSSVFKNSRWLSGCWKANKLEGTVSKVTVGSLYIYWIGTAGYEPDASTAPPEKQNPKNLKLLSCFTHANWQVGDHCLLPPSCLKSPIMTQETNASKIEPYDISKGVIHIEDGCSPEELVLLELDGVEEPIYADQLAESNGTWTQSKASPEASSCSSTTSTTKDPLSERWRVHRKKIRRVVVRKEKKLRKKLEKFEKAYMIVNTRTKVDIAWQDGTVGHGIDSTILIPLDSPGDHEFVAEQYVVEKASDDTNNTSETRRCGVIKSVNAKERTACVRWLKAVQRAEDPREFDLDEIVSVYELESHPDYDYTYGDVVVRLSPASSSTPELSDQGLLEAHISDATIGLSGDSSVDSFNLAWVGNITGLRNGDIEVTWADGMVSTVGPQAIFVVGKDDDVDDESVSTGSEVSDGGASWETVDDEDDVAEKTLEESVTENFGNIINEGNSNNSARKPVLSFPSAAIDFVTALTGIFSRDKSADKDLNISNSSGQRDSSHDSHSQKSDIVDSDQVHEFVDDLASAPVEISNHSEHENIEVTLVMDDCPHFKRFDMIKDPWDHHFLGSNGQGANGRKWLKKVQQDWTILQNNLPDGIYVRVYEDRMDLLRAVIVGAYGTPYQDGLFVFDFYLPADYPDVPPVAHYHSGGWRINPNLYEEGKVCLSLLNTWTGRGNEVWDPKASSILQVLVSLQGLVLNSRPYFNEAGYDKQIGTPEGEKNSLSYNENTFLLNCKTMMYLMRRPPKDFQELIKEHFMKRGEFILKACDAYMKGSLIGSLCRDVTVGVTDTPDSTSVGFKLMLAKILPKLCSSLSDVGANCSEFRHLIPDEK